ncbi:MAG: mechanosensitive ion channel [Muribaculum sp.]|nr:mechanosensitive ion channel [Muribaculaceae bacterium]MCM1080635.1 mechanosensitive ion channel [Muribaculum sp.]
MNTLQFENILTGTATPEITTDSIPVNMQTKLSALENYSFDELISHIINELVSFSIRLCVAILVFYIGKFIIKKLHKFISSVFTRRKIEPSLASFLLSMFQIVLYFILIITTIGILGINTASFLALFASAGVAVGLALSGTLQNFAGGVLILLLKPYKIGDYIEAQGYAGTVKEIQIFSTILTTPDNKQILIPNGGLSTSSVNNYSKEAFRRVDWTISIAYGDSVTAARETILAILASDERVVNEEGRSPMVALKELGASSVDLTVRAWTSSASYWGLFFDMNERFYNELPNHGINFPFPQLDVHMQNP